MQLNQCQPAAWDSSLHTTSDLIVDAGPLVVYANDLLNPRFVNQMSALISEVDELLTPQLSKALNE